MTGSKKHWNKRYIIADISLLMVAIFWGGGFVAVKSALISNISPFYMIAIRFFLSAILLSIIFYKKLRKINMQEIIYGSILGVMLFLGFAFQTIGLQYTTPGKQAFLTATYVVIVPFLGWIINKKNPGRMAITSAIIALIGIGLLTLKSLSINLGDSLTIICAVFFALHIVYVGLFSKKGDSIILSIVQIATAAIISFLFAIIFEKPIVAVSYEGYFSLFYLIIFSTMLAFLIQNVAQRFAKPAHTAILLSMESVFGTIFSVIFLGEALGTTMVIGYGIIFFSIIISEIKA